MGHPVVDQTSVHAFPQIIAELMERIRQRWTGAMMLFTDEDRMAQINLVEGDIVFVFFRARRGLEAVSAIREIPQARLLFQDGVKPTIREKMPPNADILAILNPQDAPAPAPGGSGATTLSTEQAAALESELVGYIGPMAGFLCQGEFDRGLSADALIDALCKHIPSDSESRQFRERAQRILGAG